MRFRRFDDMHLHLRNGQILKEVLPSTMAYASRAVVMPNTRPQPILNAQHAMEYRDEIRRARDAFNPLADFEPLMTIEIRDDTTPAMIVEAREAGVRAGKVYPRGMTTNADHGLTSFDAPKTLEVFRAMEAEGMLLLLHGERGGERILVTERESRFLPTLDTILDRFAGLRVVLEHVSTEEAVQFVKRGPQNLAATITAHHLFLTLNDVVGDGVQVNNACNPTPKSFGDRDALIEAATSGNPKFFLGSDSAPHPYSSKYCARAACGVFTAPILPELLMEVFAMAGKREALEAFTSQFGARFYRLHLNQGEIQILELERKVPIQVGSIVPFRAGETLRWKLK